MGNLNAISHPESYGTENQKKEKKGAGGINF
jgi:hypothetical protein